MSDTEAPPVTSFPVALVTGGTRGIGRAISIALAKKGCAIAMNYHRDEQSAHEAQKIVAEISAKNGTPAPILIKADLCDPAECERVVLQTVAHFKQIHILVNNHGIMNYHDIGDTTKVNFDTYRCAVQQTMQCNFEGPANLCFVAIRHFLEQNKKKSPAELVDPSQEDGPGCFAGRIISVTSRAQHRGELDCPAYAASKAALSIFTQSLARRFAANGICSYVVAPGWVETDMAKEALHGPGGAEVLKQHPLGRVAQVEECANVVAYCAMDAPPAMTGTVIDVNGASYLA